MSTEERKIVLFPAPPPTTNALSAAQRMRLVRSSKKLGRILGITPHFVDCHGVEEDVGPLAPFAFDDMLSLRSSSRASTDSHSRSSSLSSRASTDSASSTTSSFTSTSSISSRISLPSHDTWPARKPPMLRLALAAPPDLESIPASPVTPHTPRSRPRLTHRRTPPLDGSPSSSPSSSPPSPASLCTDSDPESPHPSPTAPTFTIPHPAAPSMRRAKMDRLRRTLGEGVPLRLVFPPSPSPSSDSEEEGSEPSLSLSLSSGSRSTSEESLNTPSTSPVSESLEEEKDLPRVPHSLHMRSTSELSTRRRKKTGIRVEEACAVLP
ncbi:hypothetical protein FPV67DRAFT_1197264 [Lyophyllum atratum]|nr:hypothetical protein FPV67DRAFT_1197264 [Lyophyllum atratum]